MLDSGAPIFRLSVLKTVRRRTAGIGNANVEAAKAGFDGGNEGGNGDGIRNIEGLVEDIAAGGFLDVRRGLRNSVRRTSANGDVCAFAGKFFGHSAA